VLPQSNDTPARATKRCVDDAITTLIRSELDAPIRIRRATLSTVMRAAVPETTIDEHGNLDGRKCDIDPDRP
jgi:hypothetical protein